MDVIIGKTSGFCAGVKNAVKQAENALDEEQGKVYCLGELVHNGQVVEKLESKGLKVIENIEEADSKTIIRAHGISKEIYEKAKKNKIQLIDLTCPKVLKIHRIAEEYVKKGYFIILIGHRKHPESIGTISFCGKNSYLLEDESEIEECMENVKKAHCKKVLVIAQTTYELKRFDKIVEKIKSYNYETEIENTICAATRIRQEETDKISKEVEYMIIVGGAKSSNTQKLYEISKANCENVTLVETVNDIDIEELKKYDKIGLMGGASTLNEIVEEIREKLLGGVNETKYSISRT